VKRPPLEKLHRIALRGINMEIPQAVDMAATIEYALALEVALKALKEDYADSEGCYCGQLVGGCKSDGEPLGICGYCKAVDTLGTANETPGSRDDSPEAKQK
jgi:hypothetical protein